MNNTLVYIGGFLVIALAALFAVPYFVDWNSYRGVFEEEASRVLGRDVRVGGAVNLRLLPAPYVKFEKLKIADGGGGSGEAFFRAESFTMWLSVPPLLRGILEANKVELRKPVVKLATDESGSGNWRSLSINPGYMPFVPKGVALQSVSIVDGAVSIGTPQRPEIARLEAITGELAADALDGPFRFSGTLKWDGSLREVRLSTGQQASDGSLRFKTNVRAPDTSNTYNMSGQINDLAGQPKLDGELSGTIHVSLAKTPSPPATSPKADASANDKAASPPGAEEPPTADKAPASAPTLLPASATRGGARFDFRAKLKGDSKAAELDDVALTLEQDGPPQLISGQAKVSWPGRTQLELTLTSRLLDADRLTGSDGAPVPLEAVRSAFSALVDSLPKEADTTATLVIDQLTLGGEAVSGVRLSALRSNGPLEIKGARATLPGGVRVDLDGRIAGDGDLRAFDGSMALRGQSLVRFLTWGLKNVAMGQGRADGAFALDGQLLLTGNAIEFRDATAELGGTPLSGRLKFENEPRRRLALDVEGQKIDVGHVWPGSLDPDFVLSFMDRHEKEDASGKGSGASGLPALGLGARDTDLDLRLNAAELVDGDRVLKDVKADVSIKSGSLAMPVLKFVTGDGLAVELEGEVKDVASEAKGALRGLVSASKPEAAVVLSHFLGLDRATEVRTPGSLTPLMPLRIAGSIVTGARHAHSVDVAFDGTAGGGRTTGDLRFDNGWSVWRTAPADVTFTLDSTDVARSVAALLGNEATVKGLSAPSNRAGRLLVRAVGTPQSGLIVRATAKAPGLDADYSGQVSLAMDGGKALAGALTLSAADAGAVMGLAGLNVAHAAQSLAVAGTVDVAGQVGNLTLKSAGLTVGGAKVKGTVTLEEAAPQGTKIDAEIAVDEASLPGLLKAIGENAPAVAETPKPVPAVDGKSRTAPPPASPPEGSQPIWPDMAFGMAWLERASGTIKARFDTLAVEPGLSLSDASLTAVLAPGRLDVQEIAADALGGKFKTSLLFEKAPAGATLKGALDLAISAGGKAAPGPAGPADDAVALKVEFAGRGLSPLALVTDLKGKGQLSLADVALNGKSPAAVAAAIEAALQAKSAPSSDTLVPALKAALKEGSLPLGKVAIPVGIGDGALKLDTVKIETPEGRSTFSTVVDLTSMRIDSEWQIEAKVARTPSNPKDLVTLPPVSVVYVGKLKDLAGLEPSVATGQLERELTVRRMERTVDELERLRKEDQARAKAEQQRQQAIEAERAKAAAGAQGQPAPPVAAPPAQDPASPADPTNGSSSIQHSTPGAATADVPPDGANGSIATAAEPENGQVADPNKDAAPKSASRGQRPASRQKPSGDGAWQPFQVSPF